MSECIFCRIVANDLPSSPVFRDDLVTAFLDIQPVNPGHLLVVPNAHASALSDVPVPTVCRMMEVAQRLVCALRATDVRCEAANLFLADGEAAGQEVDHVHLHVIPRFKRDGFGLRFSSDYGRLPEREELDQLADTIREAVGGVDAFLQ